MSNEFDIVEAGKAAKAGMSQAYNATPDELKDDLLDSTEQTAFGMKRFIIDDLRITAGKAGIIIPENFLGFWGVLSKAQKKGWIKNTNTTQPSARVKTHKKQVIVWESLIYKGPKI